MSLKDLRTAYNVLAESDYPVPADLLAHLSGQIRTMETRNTQRKIARMTEEQLIRLNSKQRRILRIYTSDGRMIHKSAAEATFREAFRLLDIRQVAALGLKLGRRDTVLCDATMQRRRIRNYFMLQPGFFLIANTSLAEKYDILRRVDAALRLNWDIEFV